MNGIIANLTDPSWWFSGIFFTIITFISAKIFPYFLKIIRGYLRNCKAKRQRKIKNTRFNQNLIFYHIVKANSFFVIFIIFFVDFLTFPNVTMYKTSLVYAVLNFIPVIILEFIWLTSDVFAKDVIKASDKMKKLTILKSKALRSK